MKLSDLKGEWAVVTGASSGIGYAIAELLAKPDFKALKKVDIDFDSQKDILAKLRVTTQSTMIVFKNGKEIDRQVGQTDPAEIETLFRKAL